MLALLVHSQEVFVVSHHLVLPTEEVPVVFCFRDDFRSVLLVHLLHVVSRITLGVLFFQFRFNHKRAVVKAHGEMETISRDIEGEHFRWQLDLMNNLENVLALVFTGLEELDHRVQATSDDSVANGIVSYSHDGLLEGAEIGQKL